jgi:hypothetical protein
MNRRGILTSRFITVAALMLACGAVVPFVVAQWQTGGRVNNELYGNTGGSVRYSSRPMGSTQPFSSRPMGSSQGGNFKPNNPPMQGELRHMYLASGALPSEVRAQRAQVGPLPREGPVAYIPPPRDTRTPTPGPIGNRVDPSLPMGATTGSTPSNAGAIRHSSISQGPINAEVTGKPLANDSFLFTPVSTGTSTPSLAPPGAPAQPNAQQPALPRLPTKSWDSGFDASDLQAGSIRYGSGGG